jgi:translation initiation factor 3 subunit D
MNIAVRCEVDGLINRQGKNQLLSIRTFNQGVVGPSDVDWKRKLEHQSAAALAMEVKNNSNRVARWTLSALLADSEVLKVGFVARASPKDNHNHILLCTQMQKPRDLAAQLSINMNNCWAIVKAIIDLCFKLNKDKYVLMKDPNKQLLYLYEVPANAFAMADDDEEDEDERPGVAPEAGK